MSAWLEDQSGSGILRGMIDKFPKLGEKMQFNLAL